MKKQFQEENDELIRDIQINEIRNKMDLLRVEIQLINASIKDYEKEKNKKIVKELKQIKKEINKQIIKSKIEYLKLIEEKKNV